MRVILLLLSLIHATGAHAQPRVIASIAPLQSLAAGVMDGIAEPGVIVRGGASPHTAQLRPSDAATLNRADLVIWVGPIHEAFLVRPIRGLAPRIRVLTLAREPGIEVLDGRVGGIWGQQQDDHAHGDDERDGHLFLDPVNARAITTAIAAALSALDPANAARYAANAARVTDRLGALDNELRAMLTPVRERRFVVFHDAYQYLERRYELSAVGSITVAPDRPPSAQRLRVLRREIANRGAVCVFSEPQFRSAVVRTVMEGSNARAGVLDPLGADLTPGPDAYFTLLRRLGAALRDCLAG